MKDNHVCGENCRHEHEQEHIKGHEHGNSHGHDAERVCEERSGNSPGEIHIGESTHDEAVVISGSLTVAASYDIVDAELRRSIEAAALSISERGGIVGHIKASATVTSVDMFSVTDTELTVKRSPEQEININMVAIVFMIPIDDARKLIGGALEAVRDAAAGSM